MSKRITVLVAGKVQGVGYRAFCQRYAIDMSLAGYAENLSDGRVEVVLEGAEADLEHILVFLKRGPAHAEVSHVEIEWAPAGGLKGFYVY